MSIKRRYSKYDIVRKPVRFFSYSAPGLGDAGDQDRLGCVAKTLKIAAATCSVGSDVDAATGNGSVRVANARTQINSNDDAPLRPIRI